MDKRWGRTGAQAGSTGGWFAARCCHSTRHDAPRTQLLAGNRGRRHFTTHEQLLLNLHKQRPLHAASMLPPPSPTKTSAIPFTSPTPPNLTTHLWRILHHFITITILMIFITSLMLPLLVLLPPAPAPAPASLPLCVTSTSTVCVVTIVLLLLPVVKFLVLPLALKKCGCV